MKFTQRFLVILLLGGLMLAQSCKKDSDDETPQPTPTPTPPIVMSARDSALADYNTNYLGSVFTGSVGWTGSTSGCVAGTISQAAHDAAIKRINYFRKLVGLNGNCTMDTTKYAQEQETALMMQANGTLSHTPPTTWTCYTSLGASGAGSSNLAGGGTASTAINMFMSDFGTGNEACGHRRWILGSSKTKFSDGATTNYYALYVFDTGTNTIIPEYIAYPPKGYIAQGLVFGRWSFGIPNANFSSATVAMTGPSGAVPLVVNSYVPGYGCNTLVWEPTGINTTSTSDVTYNVTVSGITGAASTSYSYSVTLFKP